MRKSLFVFGIAALSVCMMVACGSKGGSNDKEKADTEQVAEESDDEETDDEAAAPKTEAGVLAMLQEAYSDANLVAKPEDGMEPNIDLNAMYCSKAYNEKVEKIRAIDAKRTDNQCVHLLNPETLNWIYWEGQTVEMINARADVEGDTADAWYYLTNGENAILTNVQLVYEDGQWRINDFVQIGQLIINMMESMDEYIAENE